MAETKKLHLTITRVDQPIFDGEVISVRLPGVEGEMTILANHEPLISPLKAGDIVVRQSESTSKDDTQTFKIAQTGTLEIAHNEATVLI